MLLKLYSTSILVLDILLLFLKIVYSLLEGLFRTIVPLAEKSVEGEIVLVTGAGHGIGKELALQLAQLGATVVCWDINADNNEHTCRELARMGFRARAFACDVSNREQVMEVAKRVRTEVGEVTVVVNNAGIMPCHPFLQHRPEEIRRIFDINVMAHFWVLEAFLPAMVERNSGHVVALSSMAGVMGIPNLVPYCASKYAVRGLMEACAEELREHPRQPDVRFTTVCPFIVDTGLCKKPRTRFPNLLAFVPPKKAAREIIHAMRTNQQEVSIPKGLINLNHFLRLFPAKANQLIKDFMDSGVESID
ncbi:17-beta-hydroxysteroid dehydrogenase 13 isoform X2 [Bacillus rossius redtenbacheri]